MAFNQATADKVCELPIGEKVTIAGLRFGSEYALGFTTRCKPGRETVMIVREHYGGRMSTEPSIATGKKLPLQHGPAKRKRW